MPCEHSALTNTHKASVGAEFLHERENKNRDFVYMSEPVLLAICQEYGFRFRQVLS